jgi:hypothetical protein
MGLTLIAAMLSPAPRQLAPVTGGTEAPAQPVDPTVDVTLDTGNNERLVEVAQDDVVHLTVRANALDVVELRGLDLLQEIAPETPAEFDLYADTPGDYPIVLTSEDKTIGTLSVSGPKG